MREGEYADGAHDMRRRGVSPEAIREFCEKAGVTKKDSRIELGTFEACIREDLDRSVPRRLAVLRPLKLAITNYPEGEVEGFEVPNHPQRPEMGTRKLPSSRELFIERDDFMESSTSKSFRLGPGREVRQRSACFGRGSMIASWR